MGRGAGRLTEREEAVADIGRGPAARRGPTRLNHADARLRNVWRTAYQGEASGPRPVSMSSQLSTAFPAENRVKTTSGHTVRAPVAASVPV